MLQPMIRQCASLTAARELWEQLSREHSADSLETMLPCFEAFTNADPIAQELPLLAAYRANQPVALLPVMRDVRHMKGLKLNVLRTAGNDHWKAGPPIVGRDPETSISCLLEGLTRQHNWDMLELTHILQDSELLAPLISCGKRLGLRPQISGSIENPVVSLIGTWEAYYASLSANLRSQVKRAEAKLQRDTTVTFEEYTGGPDLQSRLEEFYRIEASGWKGREGTAIAADESARRFYTQLAHEASRQGSLRMYFLRANDQCIAADYCLAAGSSIYMLKIGYDETWARYSPGQVMRKRVLEHLFAAGRADIYDMRPQGGSHWGYKLRWANHVQHYAVIRLFNPRTLRGHLAAGANRLRLWLKSRQASKSPTTATADPVLEAAEQP